jgi:hypothetical protein
VCVLVGVLVAEVFKASDPLDEIVRQVVMRMLVPDDFVLVFGPTRLPSSHNSSSVRPSACRRTEGWSGPNPSHTTLDHEISVGGHQLATALFDELAEQDRSDDAAESRSTSASGNAGWSAPEPATHPPTGPARCAATTDGSPET